MHTIFVRTVLKDCCKYVNYLKTKVNLVNLYLIYCIDIEET